MSEIYIAQNGQRIPIRLEGYVWGARAFVSLLKNKQPATILMADPAVLITELRRLADHLESQSCRETRAVLSAPPQLRQPAISDLNGDPHHDFPLFVKRFGRKSLGVVVSIAEYYRKQGVKIPAVDAVLAAFDDLDLLWPERHNIISNNSLARGARSLIARKLNIKDAGNYRQRIDSAIWLLKNYPDDLLEENQAPLENNQPLLEDSDLKTAKSNSPGRRPIAANY